jgi:hypothetical protein
MDPKTEALLSEYDSVVKKTARSVYLKAEALKLELDSSIINPEDKNTIMLHCIAMLVNKASK